MEVYTDNVPSRSGLDALGGAGSHLLKPLPQCAGRSHQQWKCTHWSKSACDDLTFEPPSD